jgi:lysyl-tRNA synthetase class 2
MLALAREFFCKHGILEVETPALSRSASSDPRIESIRAIVEADVERAYYLHTSPEFFMKRLLCAGWPDCYQVSRVFRDGEIGRRHQPEFTMVEWYRLGVSLQQMSDHTAQFIATLLPDERLGAPPQSISYRHAFCKHADIDPFTTGLDELKAASSADEDLRRSIGDDRDQWLDLILTERIAPCFAPDRLTLLHHYPASQAALARLCPADPRVADRFEIFLGEMELANGYFELSDPNEQRTRCAADQAIRRRNNQALRPLDELFLDALHSTLPPCCGVAVGFDRLLMLSMQTDDIRTVQTFSFTG